MVNLLISTPAIIGIVAAAVVVLAVAIGVVGWYISCYNWLQSLKNRAEEAWSTIDVQLKKRYDLIPNLVATVKGYAKHESETLEAVISARNLAMTSAGDAKMAAENALTGTLKSLFSLQEAYPELKANANFMDLQRQLQLIETEIASARRYYNGVVKEINTKIDVFPSNFVARRMRLEKRNYFEAPEERRNVTVEF